MLQRLCNLLVDKTLTISVAESCTGGLLSATFTEIAGSSNYFKGAVVAYSNEVKHHILNVPQEILNTYGAVSSQTAQEMLHGCKGLFATDIVCVTTGIAGPDGGTSEKPVGTVFIGVQYHEINIIEKCLYKGDRGDIRRATVDKVISMIIEVLERQ